jgi:ribonuclease P protein component
MPPLNSRAEERFPKRRRLLKRQEFLRVQQDGAKVHSRAFLGLVLVGRPDVRIGITTSKRLGSAVQRNRLRRLVREAFRRGFMQIPEQAEVVVIPKKCAVDMDGRDIIEDLGLLSKRMGAIGKTQNTEAQRNAASLNVLRKSSCDGSSSD